MDVPNPAILEERRGDEQAVVSRLLDERDDRREVLRLGRQRGEARIVEPDRHLRGEILEEVAGQPELGEHDQPGAAPARLGDERVMPLQVLVEQAEPRRDLGEGDGQRLHGPLQPPAERRREDARR